MDSTIASYQNCIKDILSTYQQHTSNGGVTVELVFDDERQHYVAIRVGWVKQRSVYLCLVHLDICDDMIVIQANNTEDAIDEELMERGVPQEKICLGVLPPEVREDVFHRREEPQHQRKITPFAQQDDLSHTTTVQYA